uniref:SNF2 domain-containing protein CLASSY 3-like n=1 Tax=Fragaria vesca subsp. vesca TaxID=101020 RepID=UPI0005CB7893|nr:PREDICTED: SNF2 domain-containing protein CLASSY 3-like [Fragaria vesca subsp. vesca]
MISLFWAGKCGVLVLKFMDYRPVSARTRSKTLLKLNGELKKSSGVTPASRSEKMRRSNQASVSHVGESSTRKQSFEWVAGNVEYLDNQQNYEVSVSFDSREGVTKMMMDSDDVEVVVSNGKEGGRGGVDVDDVSDCGSDEDVSSTEGDDSSDGSVSPTEKKSSEEEYDEESDESVSSTEEAESDEESVSSSDEDSSEEEKEEETELTGKDEKECKGESVDVGLKRKRNDEDDLHCSYGPDIDDRSEKVSKGETVEVGLEGKIIDNCDDLHSSSSSSGHDINDRSDPLGQAEAVLAEVRTGCDKSDDYRDERVWKEQSVGVGSKENRTGDVRNQCKNSEGDSSLTKKKSSRAPIQKRVPTVAFQPPKVEGLPLRFTFVKQPTIPEKSDYDIEVENLLVEYKFAMAYDNASTILKAKENNFTRSDNNRNDVNAETYGGSSETAINNGRTSDLQTLLNENEAAKGNHGEMHGGTSESGFTKGSKFDVQSVCKKGVKAKGNKFSRSNNTGKDDNGETYGDGHLKAYKKKAGVKNLANKKGTRAPKECNAFSILLDSIYDKEEVSGKKLPHCWDKSLRDEAPKDDAPKDESLPLFFTFGHPPSPPPEKSDFEIEIDNLFDEYNLVGISGEIGSTDFNVVETNDSVPPGKEVTQHVLCSQGKHNLVLDEEIGLICRFCRHVHREIKYILPDFAPNPYGKYGKRFYEEGNQSILDDLQCNDHNDSGVSFHSHTEGTVWDLIPGVESDMYPHQRDGFEFIWRHLAGGTQLKKLAQPTDYEGDGCIISHAPGTGKTRLTIIFIQSYMKFNPLSRPLIVAPRTMLLTWVRGV